MTGFNSKRNFAQERVVVGADGRKYITTEPRLDQGPDYERGFVDGMLHQTQSSVDKAVNRMAQPVQEPVAWMNNKDFEPIRVRIMQEAYELADRNDSESYNAIKVMCGDVQRMLPPKRPWVGLTQKEVQEIHDTYYKRMGPQEFARAIEAALKEKNFD
jgi:hypothetical protein